MMETRNWNRGLGTVMGLSEAGLGRFGRAGAAEFT
jgi:hypothetical protein